MHDGGILSHYVGCVLFGAYSLANVHACARIYNARPPDLVNLERPTDSHCFGCVFRLLPVPKERISNRVVW